MGLLVSQTATSANMKATRFYCVGRSNRSEEHTSELQSRLHLVCRLLLEKNNNHHHGDKQKDQDHSRFGVDSLQKQILSEPHRLLIFDRHPECHQPDPERPVKLSCQMCQS